MEDFGSAVLAWCGLSVACGGLTYALKPRFLFGKSAQGSMPIWAGIIFGPYFSLTWLSWRPS